MEAVKAESRPHLSISEVPSDPPSFLRSPSQASRSPAVRDPPLLPLPPCEGRSQGAAPSQASL